MFFWITAPAYYSRGQTMPAMNKVSAITFLLSLFFFTTDTLSQTFTFECVCRSEMVGDTCDVCPGTNIQSRSFSGLLIYRNGSPYRWIDEPYSIRVRTGNSVEFLEQVVNPEKITIQLSQTPFSTLGGFVDSTFCACNGSGGLATVAVDTPMVGDGSIADPLTIGQFGADTTMVLRWNGSYWYPDRLDVTKLNIDLPYYVSDSAALADGLVVGDPYLLECNNAYDLPAGLWKVVKVCGVDCAVALRYFPSDVQAGAAGIPAGKEYVLDELNIYGLMYGMVKVITTGITGDTLHCNTTLPEYANHAAAIVGGLAEGDHYTLSASNTYGSPEGMQAVVSSVATTSADPQICCSDTKHLPFFDNDTAAVSGGLSAGYYYYLSSANTYGYPYGTKKRVQ